VFWSSFVLQTWYQHPMSNQQCQSTEGTLVVVNKLFTGEQELTSEVETLLTALAAFDVLEPMPDDGDITETTLQLELCVVCIVMCFRSNIHIMRMLVKIEGFDLC